MTEPYAHHAGEGRSFWWTPAMLRVEKADSGDTGGAFALSEVTVDAGYVSPPHVHSREDEALYILDGELEVWFEGEPTRGGPGSFFYMPRHRSHSWIVGDQGVRLLILLSPGGFEGFYATHGSAAPQPPTLTRDDVERITREEYGIELVPPPPNYPVAGV